MSSSGTIPISSQHEDAHEKCVAALVPDMPLLMHGSGDVGPYQVDPKAAALLARLTTEYISQLCTAAVDAHDMLTDGEGGLLPPPSLEKRGIHPVSYKDERRSVNRKRKKQPGVEYWDDPLPDPKIKGYVTTLSKKPVPWVGLAGADFQANSRCRKHHVQQAIGTRSFIFPICHDAELYQRVVKLQAATREMAQLLEDPVVMDMVREEMTKPTVTDDDGAQEDLVEAEWPGMEGLLPIHKFCLEDKKLED